jgi:hypothetical protein
MEFFAGVTCGALAALRGSFVFCLFPGDPMGGAFEVTPWLWRLLCVGAIVV